MLFSSVKQTAVLMCLDKPQKDFLLDIYANHGKWIWGIAVCGVKNVEWAKDVVQNIFAVFINDIEDLMTIEEAECLSEYIFRTVRLETLYFIQKKGIANKNSGDYEAALNAYNSTNELKLSEYMSILNVLFDGMQLNIPTSLDEKIYSMIEKSGRKEDVRSILHTGRQLKSAIAAILVLCIGISSLFIVNPNAAVAVKNLLYEVTQIPIFDPNGNQEGVLISANSKGVPSYVPSGYQLVENTVDDEGIITLHYEAEKEYLTIKVYPLNYQLVLDDENADRVVAIEINGSDGILIEKNGVFTLGWFSTQGAYKIKTTLPYDEVIKVAKSI